MFFTPSQHAAVKAAQLPVLVRHISLTSRQQSGAVKATPHKYAGEISSRAAFGSRVRHGREVFVAVIYILLLKAMQTLQPQVSHRPMRPSPTESNAFIMRSRASSHHRPFSRRSFYFSGAIVRRYLIRRAFREARRDDDDIFGRCPFLSSSRQCTA